MTNHFNHTYPVLSVVSIILRILGWLIILLGMFILLSMFSIDKGASVFGSIAESITEALANGLFALFFGFVAVALSEGIKVLLHIEANTRMAVDMMEELNAVVRTPQK